MKCAKPDGHAGACQDQETIDRGYPGGDWTPHSCSHCLRMLEVNRNMSAERNAARAELARLRAAIEAVLHAAPGEAEALREMLDD